MRTSKRKRHTIVYIFKAEKEKQRASGGVFVGFNPYWLESSPDCIPAAQLFKRSAVVWPLAKLFNKLSAPSLSLSPARQPIERDKARIFPAQSS
jgi:hypothetical protein